MAQMNLTTKHRQTVDIENRLVLAKGEDGGSGIAQEFRIHRCNYYIQKDKQGNYIQSLKIDHDGKEYTKEYTYTHMCVCIHKTESLCYAAEIGTMLQINYILI